MNNLSKIYKALKAAEKSRMLVDINYDAVLHLLLENFDFPNPSEYDTNVSYFHIEYQPSDGIVLADNDSNVYHLPFLLDYINKNGAITDYYTLKRFQI